MKMKEITMTSINRKLAAAIATIAMLVPAVGAQAANRDASHAARHFAASASQRHFTTSRYHRQSTKLRRAGNNWR
jgi:hypothetical protein